AVVVAYGLLLPKPILDAPRLGCLNVHASLLPRWRGAAPIQRAILAGDRETGITIMQMEEGLDTGPILLQQRLPIGPATTAAELHDELAALGARLIVEALDGLAQGTLEAKSQPAKGATYAAKLSRAEARLDWTRPAEELMRRVRALTPWPGAYTELPSEKGSERLKVLAAEAVPRADGAVPGTVLDDLTVACGEGALRLVTVQRAGKAAMSGADFLRGVSLAPGTVLASGPDEQP
ncbi:MAG: methionyl-tRNA formyltransferase, partial [Kiloniellales bacterium]